MSYTINEYAARHNLSEINLHLGCGGEALEGWINIDNYDYEASDSSRSGAKYDIKMDIKSLDAAPGSVDKILLVHVLEHFVRWEALDLLAQFHALLKPGGLLIMEHPDLDGCIKMYLENSATIDTPLGTLNKGFTQFYGNQWDRLDYETHRYVWTKREMRQELKSLGYEIVVLDNDAQFHVPGRDMRVMARKPASADNKAVPNSSSSDIFNTIYTTNAWGTSPDSGNPFYSGRASHEESIVAPYVAALKGFFSYLGVKPSVLDIGCGDFNVGSKLVNFCSSYVACDVVPDLVAHNALQFGGLGVEFKVLDVTSEEVPEVDVILVRQVFQYLSNADIEKALKNISNNCRYLIVTEQIPQGDFTPNHDKATGDGIRAAFGSGVVLSSPPFAFNPLSEHVLCSIDVGNGIIRTTAYAMR
jgi:predicted SAM-dependent methyltransferase